MVSSRTCGARAKPSRKKDSEQPRGKGPRELGAHCSGTGYRDPPTHVLIFSSPKVHIWPGEKEMSQREKLPESQS